MSAFTWSRLTPRAIREDGDGVVVRIEVRAEEATGVPAMLSELRRDAARFLNSGEVGTWEAQWCAGAARIAIEGAK